MMNDIENSLSAWRSILGSENVLTDITTRQLAQTTNFATTQNIPAIIRPGNTAEVQECVKIANHYQTPIYPVSTGKNWGLGSRVPVQDNCVVMELSRLNQITDYNKELAYVTIEPGVTQLQLINYLNEQHSGLFLSVTGSTPNSSVIGNILERGVGKGPYGYRCEQVCGFEVILPTGECIHTGFERFADAKVAKVNRWGLGPSFDGLFTQSNLGIVTQMTIWLQPYPKYLQTFVYSITNESHLETHIDSLRQLKLAGIIRGTFLLTNDYRILSVQNQYPWQEAKGKTPLPPEILTKLRKKVGNGLWFGAGALYSESRQQGRIERKLIKQALKKTVDRLFFFDETMARLAKIGQPVYKWLTGIDIADLFDDVYNKSLFRGIPDEDEQATMMTYWRKKIPIPSNRDPDRDNCGLIWCLPAVPFAGWHVKQATKIIVETMNSYQFEPSMGMMFISERCLYITAAIVYDREVAGEDERAMACHDTMLQKLNNAGYLPIRLGIQSMNSIPASKDDYGTLFNKIKKTLDPNNILAPGRYDFLSGE